MRAGIKRTLGQLKNAKLAPRTLVGKTGTFAELGQDAMSKIKTARLPILGEDVEAIKKLDKGITSIAGVKRSWAEQIDSSVGEDLYQRAFKKFPEDPELNQFRTKAPKLPIADTPVAPKPRMKDTTAVDTKTIEEAMAKLKGNGVTSPSSSTGERVSLSGNPKVTVQDVVQDVVQENISSPKKVAEQAKKFSQGQGSKLDSGGVTQGQKRMYNAVTKGSAVSAMFIAGTGILDAMHTSVKNNNARRRNEEQLKEQEKKQREAREKNRKRNRRNANYNQSHTMGSIVFDMFNDRTGHHLMGNNRF